MNEERVNMEWNDLDATARVIIQTGAALTAMTAIALFIRRVHRWLQVRYASLEWVFSEEHEHKKIQEALDKINSQLVRNGGSSLVDSLDRIENQQTHLGRKQDFISSYMRVSLQAQDKAIFETDPTGAVIYVNKAFTRLMGIGSDEAMGWGFENVLDPKHRDSIIEKWLKAVESQRDYDEYVEYVNGVGRKFTAHAMAYLIRNDKGEPLGYLGEVLPLDKE